MIEDHPIPVWIDDPSPVFRLGLAPLLELPGFRLTGDSCRFAPRPDVAGCDWRSRAEAVALAAKKGLI